VIINNFNAIWPVFCPCKADSPLIIDADAVLTFAISMQGFQSMQEIQSLGVIQLGQFTDGRITQAPELTRALSFKHGLGVFAGKGLDGHADRVLRSP